MIIGSLLFILTSIFWLWMLVDCIAFNQNLDPAQKILWACAIFFFHCIWAVLYYLIGRDNSPTRLA